MGTDTIAARTDGTTILATHPNVIRSALCGDLVPRNASGIATALAGSLGSTTYPFLKASIASGGWILGDIKMHHTYNGAAPIGHGWMLCDGRQITEALYNTEHGASTFATYVGSTALLNKYLPNFTSKYPVGKATTPQDGSIAITFVGNASSTINIQHTHTMTPHNHQWLSHLTGGSAEDKMYNAVGTIQSVPTHTAGSIGNGIQAVAATGSELLIGPGGGADVGTSLTTSAMDSQLSSVQNIQPHSVEVQYFMRIV